MKPPHGWVCLLLQAPAGPLRTQSPWGPLAETGATLRPGCLLGPQPQGALGVCTGAAPAALGDVCSAGLGAALGVGGDTAACLPAATQVDDVVDQAAGEEPLGHLRLGSHQVPHGVAGRGQDVLRVAGVASVAGEEPGHFGEHLVPWESRRAGPGVRGWEERALRLPSSTSGGSGPW